MHVILYHTLIEPAAGFAKVHLCQRQYHIASLILYTLSTMLGVSCSFFHFVTDISKRSHSVALIAEIADISIDYPHPCPFFYQNIDALKKGYPILKRGAPVASEQFQTAMRQAAQNARDYYAALPLQPLLALNTAVDQLSTIQAESRLFDTAATTSNEIQGTEHRALPPQSLLALNNAADQLSTIQTRSGLSDTAVTSSNAQGTDHSENAALAIEPSLGNAADKLPTRGQNGTPATSAKPSKHILASNSNTGSDQSHQAITPGHQNSNINQPMDVSLSMSEESFMTVTNESSSSSPDTSANTTLIGAPNDVLSRIETLITETFYKRPEPKNVPNPRKRHNSTPSSVEKATPKQSRSVRAAILFFHKLYLRMTSLQASPQTLSAVMKLSQELMECIELLGYEKIKEAAAPLGCTTLYPRICTLNFGEQLSVLKMYVSALREFDALNANIKRWFQDDERCKRIDLHQALLRKDHTFLYDVFDVYGQETVKRARQLCLHIVHTLERLPAQNKEYEENTKRNLQDLRGWHPPSEAILETAQCFRQFSRKFSSILIEAMFDDEITPEKIATEIFIAMGADFDSLQKFCEGCNGGIA